jgi:hypothetical protein
VSAVRFSSTHINTLLASPAGIPPASVTGPTAPAGPASGRRTPHVGTGADLGFNAQEGTNKTLTTGPF